MIYLSSQNNKKLPFLSSRLQEIILYFLTFICFGDRIPLTGVVVLKKKVGMVIDEELIFKVKQKALSSKMPLNQILEDALRTYLLTVNKNNKRSAEHITGNKRCDEGV